MNVTKFSMSNITYIDAGARVDVNPTQASFTCNQEDSTIVCSSSSAKPADTGFITKFNNGFLETVASPVEYVLGRYRSNGHANMANVIFALPLSALAGIACSIVTVPVGVIKGIYDGIMRD